MAIPGWVWPPDEPSTPDRDGELTTSDRTLGSAEVEAASEAFQICSDPTRLEILLSLSAAEPLSYADLRTEAAVDDKGRFNYHLRRLDGLIERVDGEYSLSRRGRRLVGGLLTDGRVGLIE